MVVNDLGKGLANLGIKSGDVKREESDFKNCDAIQFIAKVIKMVVQKQAPLFIDIDLAQRLVEPVQQKLPSLVATTIPNIISWIELTDILRRLVEDDVSISNMPRILQVLSQQNDGIQDTTHLTELVRHGLSDQITKQLLKRDQKLYALRLDKKLEDYITSTISHTSVGPYIDLSPEITDRLLTEIRKEVSIASHCNWVIIVRAPILRRFIRKLVELEFPWLQVFSINDLLADTKIEYLAEISHFSDVSLTESIRDQN